MLLGTSDWMNSFVRPEKSICHQDTDLDTDLDKTGNAAVPVSP